MRSQDWEYLEVRPIGDEFAQLGDELGFRPTGQYFRHVIDLQPDYQDLFKTFDKDSVQRRVKHADRVGLIEKRGISIDLLRDFYRLFVITRRRHRVPPPPFMWFRNLVNCEGGAAQILAAYTGDTPIAAVLTLLFKKTAYFKYGCSDARFNRFGATPWLLWKAISAAKASGALQFDMGRTQEENLGLLTFKNHWVPSAKRLTYWRFSDTRPLDKSSAWKLELSKHLFSHMPNALLILSGKLIYRHIG